MPAPDGPAGRVSGRFNNVEKVLIRRAAGRRPHGRVVGVVSRLIRESSRVAYVRRSQAAPECSFAQQSRRLRRADIRS
jgi:hypothetical protein